MITISLSPNTEKDDILLALKLVFCRKKKGKAIKELEDKFKEYLGVKYAFSFNSGRSSLMAILQSLDLKGDVLLQSFTCNAAANPIIWSGTNPVYQDCDENTFNIGDIKRTDKSKIVMVQHTFGIPADITKVPSDLILIEDCAHALGAEYNGKKVGTFGKAAFFSFSRDKIISSVYGGMVVTNDDALAEKIKKFQEEIGYPSSWWILQQLLHPLLMNWLILPTYKLFIGKAILVLSQWFHILSKAVHWEEKQGIKPSYFPKRMPNALALLALNQFKKLERFNNHRKEIANFYRQNLKGFTHPPKIEGSVYLRYPVKHPKAHEIIKKAWKKNILIGDWYTNPVAPADTNLDKLKYTQCPNAEKLSKITLNLPTHINISLKEAKTIVDFLNKLA